MELKDLQKFVDKNWNKFEEKILHNYNPNLKPQTINGVEFKVISSSLKYGDTSTEQVVFEVDGQLFAIDGYTNSWDGTCFGEASDIYRVEKTTLEITVYNRLNV